MADILIPLGHLAGGSRFKRISDKLYIDGNRIYKDKGLPFKSTWFSVYYALASAGAPLTILDIASHIAFTHITVKNILREMEDEGLVTIKPNPADKRSKLVTLSPKGKNLLKKLQPLWTSIAKALGEVFTAGHPDIVNILNRIDREIDRYPIYQRVDDPRQPPKKLTSNSYTPEKGPIPDQASAKAPDPDHFFGKAPTPDHASGKTRDPYHASGKAPTPDHPSGKAPIPDHASGKTPDPDHSFGKAPLPDPPPQKVSILDYTPALKTAFQNLVRPWLLEVLNGRLEKEDEYVLDNPEKAYLDTGGFIFFARVHQPAEGPATNTAPPARDEIAGCVVLKRLDNAEFEFAKLYIKNDYRNLGIATRLIERCITRCKENEARRLWLQTTLRMPAAHRLYYKLGFKDNPAPPHMHVLNRTEKIMSLDLI